MKVPCPKCEGIGCLCENIERMMYDDCDKDFDCENCNETIICPSCKGTGLEKNRAIVRLKGQKED